MTALNGLQAPQGAPSHITLTPMQAKRLLGVLRVSEHPVRYAGHVVAYVQRKRHPYDEWSTLQFAGQVDAAVHSLKYRAGVK